MSIDYRLTVRAGFTAEWVKYDEVLLEGELGYDLDTAVLKIGDGKRRWSQLPTAGSPNAYVMPGTGLPQTLLDADTRVVLDLARSVYSRFAPQAQVIEGRDLNELVQSGQYRGHTLGNAPVTRVGGWFYVEVIAHDPSFVTQRATGLNSESGPLGAVFVRTRENGTWQAWTRVMTLTGGVEPAALQTAAQQGEDAYRRFAPNAFNLAAATKLDDLRESGQYRGNSMQNTPGDQPQEWFYVEVVAHGSDYALQRATQFTGSGRNRTWQRQRYADTWEAWAQVYNESRAVPFAALEQGTRDFIAQGVDTYRRFGPKAQQLNNGTDLDQIWQSGQYRCVAPAKAPIVVPGEWWFIEVISHEPGNTIQRATGMTGYYAGISYTRANFAGAWTPWRITGGGDTGTRSINAAMTNVVIDGNSACTIRRVNNLVTLKLINFRRSPGNLAPEPVYTVPAGFRSPTEETGSGVNEGGTGALIGAFVYNGGRIRLFSLPDTETYNKVSMTWITDEAWPVALP